MHHLVRLLFLVSTVYDGQVIDVNHVLMEIGIIIIGITLNLNSQPVWPFLLVCESSSDKTEEELLEFLLLLQSEWFGLKVEDPVKSVSTVCTKKVIQENHNDQQLMLGIHSP